MATRLLPELKPGVSVPENLRNGTDPADFTIGPSRDALLTFRSQETASQDTIGCYLIGQDGTIEHPVVLFPDSSKVPAWTTIRLSEVYSGDLLQPGTRFGLFLIADGAGDNPGGTGQPNPGLSEGETVRVAFARAGEDPRSAPASIDDALPPDLYAVDINPSGGVSFSALRGDIYHSASPALNIDGLRHVVSGLEVGSRPTIDSHPDWDTPDKADVRQFTLAAELRDGILAGFEDLKSDFEVASDFDFNDVVLQVNVGADGLQPLQNGIAVPADQINGVDPSQLTIGPARDAKLVFDSETAGAKNALGVYLVDAAGTMRDPRFVFPQVEQVDRVDRLPIDRPGNPFPLDDFGEPTFLHREDSVALRDFYSPEQLQPDTRFGLFVVADGGQLNSDSVLHAPALAFRHSSNGAPATIFDRADQIELLAFGSNGEIINEVRGPIFHTSDPTPSTPGANPLNTGGQGQAVSGIADETTADGRTVRVVSVGFEDLVANSTGSDRDFNDLVVRVEIPETDAAKPSVLRTFTGPSGNFAGIDPHIAVGPDHVVITQNARISIYDKEGELLNSHHLGRGFFPDEFFAPGPLGLASPDSTGRVRDFDPGGLDSRVLYDGFSDRFVFSSLILESNGPRKEVDSRVVLGISETNDPSGEWHFQYVSTAVDGGWSDYPTLGLDEEALYLSGNMFDLDGDQQVLTGSKSRLWIIDKGQGSGGFYDGGPAENQVYDPANMVGAQSLTWQPALVVGPETPTGNTGTFLSGYDSGELEVIRVDDPLGQPQFNLQTRSILDQRVWRSEDTAPQLITPDARLAFGDDKGINNSAGNRVHDAVWRDGTLYFVLSTGASGSDTSDAGQTTAYLLRVDTSNPGQLTFADPIKIGGEDIAPETHVLYPSVAVNDAGDVAVGFTGAGPNLFPGAYVAGILNDGTPLPAVAVREGEASYWQPAGDGRNRWGDYSGAAVDPSDDQTFWTFNMYAATRGDLDSLLQAQGAQGDGRFETVIGHVALDDGTLIA